MVFQVLFSGGQVHRRLNLPRSGSGHALADAIENTKFRLLSFLHQDHQLKSSPARTKLSLGWRFRCVGREYAHPASKTVITRALFVRAFHDALTTCMSGHISPTHSHPLHPQSHEDKTQLLVVRLPSRVFILLHFAWRWLGMTSKGKN